MAKVTPSHSSPICVWRYSLWIPLYPIGFICEGVIAYKSIIYLEETQRWVWKKWKIATTTIPLEARFSLLLPNSWNIGFHPPNLIRFYLLFGFFPMLYNQMCHMYHLRFQLEQQFKILPFEMIRCKKLGQPDSQRMTKQEWIMLQTWYELSKHVKVFIQIVNSILWSFSNIIAFSSNIHWAVLTSGQTPEQIKLYKKSEWVKYEWLQKNHMYIDSQLSR